MKRKILAVLLLSLSVIGLAIPVHAQYTINSVFGNLMDCDTMTRSIYIVWWDHDFDLSAQVDVLLDSMVSYRNTCLDELHMADPPNPDDGYYYNVYIHVPGDTNDIFHPFGWGNGQGTDINGYPFLTLPSGVLGDWLNNSHETFHIFQYSGNSPGFSYSGNSQWYIEASANWFAAKQNPGLPRAFIEAESLVRVPMVPLWLSYNNYPDYYPSNWQRYVHQYALALLLYYLTDESDLPDTVITEGFYNGTEELPQEYLFNLIGPSGFRQDFIDWAAHMTNQFDFISPAQAAANENEWNNYADHWDDKEYIRIYQNTGTEGWYRPPDSVVTNAWSFNTYKILNNSTVAYTFELNGDVTGSYGDSAFFQGKVVVQNSVTGASFFDLNMSDSLQGSFALDVTPTDTAVYFIVASMPGIFRDDNELFQLFSYEINIFTSPTGIPEPGIAGNAKEIGRYNLLGQPVTGEKEGIQVILYDDGHTVKKLVRRAH